MEVSWGADAASKADSDTEQNGVKCAIVSDSDKVGLIYYYFIKF